MNASHVAEPASKADSTESVCLLPLSFAQHSLWFIDQLDRTHCAYNLPDALVITGALDVATLERSLSEVVRRHQVLRTSFPTVEGQPIQFIVSERHITLPITDLRKLEPAERMTRAHQVIETEAWTPFELAQGPLLRVKLLRTEEQQHLLFLGVHHIVCDDRSKELLIGELLTVYQAFVEGREPELPELPIQYADYANRQRTLVESGRYAKQLEYWRTQLSDLPVLELPTDRPRPSTQTFWGANEPIVFPSQLTDTLKEFSKSEGATFFMTMLAAFQVLLARYSGQEDIVVGSNCANRGDNDTVSLIGFFSNMLVCRTQLSGDPTFREVVRQVREMTLGANQNHEIPFESLIEELAPKRDISQNPLFQVMFDLVQDLPKSYSVRDLRLERVAIEDRTAKLDLSMILFDGQDGLRGYLNYNTDLFDSVTVQRMASHFRTLVEGMGANLDARISELPLIDEAERDKILLQWNDTYRDYPRNVRLDELIGAQVQRTPDAIAVVFENARLTYSEVDRRANRLAHRLRKMGVGSEVIVGLFAERSIEMIVGLVATLKAGGAYLPLDPSYPAERLNFMLSDARPIIVLVQRSLVAKLPQYAGKIIFLEDDFTAESDATPAINTQPDNLAYVIYTSGSTGQPKGVMNTHRGICNWLIWLQETYPLTNDDRILQKTIFTFDVSLGEFFWSLIAGSQLVIARPGLHGDSQYLIRTICENRVTVIHFVPSMLSAFLEDKNAARCSSLRHVICIGEALPAELQARFFAVLPQAELHNLYGPTEAAVVVTYWKCERGSTDHIVPIGRPVANTQIYILDRMMQPIPTGAIGEIHIGGVQVASGYLARPELTAEKFIANPFGEGRLYKTGDLARYRNDGAIEFLGRIDHQVKLRGFRIELGEIEAVLETHPAVHGAVVLARQNKSEESRLVAYVAGYVSRLKVNDLRALLKAKLPIYMLPSAIVVLEKFPLSSNGKIDRRALPAPSFVRGAKAFVEPRDSLEAQLAAIWERSLRMEPIGVTDDFFEIGGDSLLALRIFVEIQKTMGHNLPLATLFQTPTIEKLAAALRQEGWKPNWAPIVAVQPHGSRPPFFCVHGGFGGVLFYGQLARCLGTEQPLYGLQAEGLDGGPIEHPTVPSMANYYLNQMRQVQPHGPYLFGGYSFGGVVAFEMAHQLRRAGEEVALLVLFDSLDDRSRHSLFHRIRLGLQARAFSPSVEKLRSLLRRTRNKLTTDLVNRLLNARNLLSQNIPLEEASDFGHPSAVQRVQSSNLQALSIYKFRPYPGRVILFRAEDPDDGRPHPADNGWTKYAGGGIEIHNIPGQHQAIFAQPNVRSLADKLDACIRAALAENVPG